MVAQPPRLASSWGPLPESVRVANGIPIGGDPMPTTTLTALRGLSDDPGLSAAARPVPLAGGGILEAVLRDLWRQDLNRLEKVIEHDQAEGISE